MNCKQAAVRDGRPCAIGVMSLGCAKNRVDTENMLGLLQQAGYAFTPDPSEAEAIVVNTCGFVQDAKQESINAILEMAEYKNTGRLRALVVTGCLSQRYREELADALPEVDAFLGVSSYSHIVDAVKQALDGQKSLYFDDADGLRTFERVLTTQPYTAYVRIAEGCSNCCSYCAIPAIRGPYRSRPMEDIVSEAKTLAGRGVLELTLIAQDTTRYGLDLYGEPRLAALLKRVADIRGLAWVRVLYGYPESVTPEIVDAVRGHERICNYIDMPMQHLDDGVLARMDRRGGAAAVRDAVRTIREKDADFILRTTVITGFPGETENEHKTLTDGLSALRFDRMGVFRYSREEGTKAARMAGQIPAAVKRRRYGELMALQACLSREKNEARVGRVYRMLVEGLDEQSGLYYGRTYAEAPEVDGKVFVRTNKRLTAGTFHDVLITEAFDYDLMGELR